MQRNDLANCQLKILIFRSSGKYLKMSFIRGFCKSILELTFYAFQKGKTLDDWIISLKVMINIIMIITKLGVVRASNKDL